MENIYVLKYGLKDEETFNKAVESFDLNKENLGEMGKYISDVHYLEFYERQNYDADHTEEASVYFRTGKNSRIYYQWKAVYDRLLYSPEPIPKQIVVEINKNRLTLPPDCDLVAVHKAVMVYDYALTELKKMRHQDALESVLYTLKKSLEADFKEMKNGNQKTITTDIEKHLKTGVVESLYEAIDVENQSTIMVCTRKLPLRKYPTTREEFDKIAKKLQPKYEEKIKEMLEKRQKREEKKQQRAEAKEERKQKKIAHKKKLSLAKKQHEDLIKDITEPNFQ